MVHNKYYKSSKQVSHVEHCLNKALWEIRSDFLTKEGLSEIIQFIEKGKQIMKMSAKEYKIWFNNQK
jgi:hypothetical protein